MEFAALAPNEDPELGLFYLERPSLIDNPQRANFDTRLPRAAGIAFLADESGLLATASHVPLLCGARPGERLAVFGATADLSIEVQAEVLAEGWMGPITDDGVHLPVSPFWNGIVDERPEIFRQDLAFLRVIPQTARWHQRGTKPMPTSPAVEDLLNRARYLPLGLANNRARGDDLRCWTVVWEHGAPACQPASGSLEGIEPGLFDALRFKSSHVGYGFSGSPVWHVQRRVVVGVHRRSVLALPETRIACDSRALVRAISTLGVPPDRRLIPLLERPYDDQNSGAPQRHPEFLNWHNPQCLVEQEISEVLDFRLQQDASTPARLPAMQYLLTQLSGEARCQILLLGAPGAGKSTLLRRLATSLADRSRKGAPCPIVPVLVSAMDLVKAKLDLRQVLNDQLARVRAVDADPVDVLVCVQESGARLVLLVDGLDEVAKESCSKILGSILRSRRPGEATSKMEPDLLHHVVIASRQTDDTRRPAGPDRAGLQRFNLHALGSAESRELALALVGELSTEQRLRLEAGLADLRLTSAGATPLQVWMASVVFRRDGELPKRPLDLIHKFVGIVTSDALERIRSRPGLRISERAEATYVPAINAVLALVADIGYRHRESSLTESFLTNELCSIRSGPAAPIWLTDVKELVAFILEALPAAIGVLTVTDTGDGDAKLEWVHASFREYFAACHVLDKATPTIEGRSELFQAWLGRSDHWPALTLVSEMERRAESDLRERDAVEAVLNHCLVAAATVSKPRLFALRALAVGIDAHGRSRRKQVRVLVRSYVADYTEPSSCESLYRNDDLPDPDGIVSRPDLRNDIREVLEERFSGRLKLAAIGRAPRILAKEAKLIEQASLWSEMEALGLRRPIANNSSVVAGGRHSSIWSRRSTSAEPHGVGGTTRLVMQSRTGELSAIDMPSMAFAESLVQASRGNPGIRSTARLVAIASSWIVEQADDSDRPMPSHE